ncbi:NAD(P)-dependent oxidoreductase [Streptomyces sp. NPDC001797]|uniref:NAD(P)-dependent oxidoreductase n=1 Tax=Streptomyces sp. NPDC001797 TaxID=3364610 RepID=UPI0036B9C1A2
MSTDLPARRHTAPRYDTTPGHADRPARRPEPATPPIAFLGTGRMGGPMAANLARAGFDVRVWNRTADRAAPLIATGAVVAPTPADAVRGAGILITMLTDGPATDQAATGPDGFLAAAPGMVWVQMGTIGADWTARLARTAARSGVTFVDAPVSGSEGPARAGQLVVLASGPERRRTQLAPVFAALAKATVWLGPAGNGTNAKLVLNNWLVDLAETTAETLSFARRLGLDPGAIVDLLQSTPLGSPYAMQKAATMLTGDFTPAFALRDALKDAELAVQAAQASGTELALTQALLPRWRHAAERHADDDLAAVYTTA